MLVIEQVILFVTRSKYKHASLGFFWLTYQLLGMETAFVCSAKERSTNREARMTWHGNGMLQILKK